MNNNTNSVQPIFFLSALFVILHSDLSRLCFLCIDCMAFCLFVLFRFNRRSSVHGSPVSRKQRSGICHFRHQRHSVFANSADASCRSSRRHVAASGFGSFHTPSGMSKMFNCHKKQILAMILNICEQVYVCVGAHPCVMYMYIK